jgi:glycosyltransferase involved in cell wall biosynthesis
MIGMLREAGYRGPPLGTLPCFALREPSSPGGHKCSESIRIAYFGRLASNKGVDLAIHAFADARLGDAATFDIHGDGVERDRLQAVIDSVGVASSVTLKGNYPDGEMRAQLMSSYDALVVPSQRLEGLPLVLLEAMSCGTPVLTTRVGAIPDCCEGNPDFILVDPDRASLSGGLSQLVAGLRAGAFDRERLRAFYVARFSRAAMADQWRLFLSSPRTFFDKA